MLPILLSGCFTVQLDHVVRDTTEAGKSAYQSLSTKWDAKKMAKSGNVIAHSYVGANTQSIDTIKQLCVTEAVQKLRAIAGVDEVAYTVTENAIAAINGKIVANCKVGLNK